MSSGPYGPILLKPVYMLRGEPELSRTRGGEMRRCVAVVCLIHDIVTEYLHISRNVNPVFMVMSLIAQCGMSLTGMIDVCFDIYVMMSCDLYGMCSHCLKGLVP